jgi:hypothetical protein
VTMIRLRGLSVGRCIIHEAQNYPSWTKSGHELALDPINPAVRQRIIDLPIFQRRAKPTANDLYVAMGAAVQGAALPGAEVSAVACRYHSLHFRYQRRRRPGRRTISLLRCADNKDKYANPGL